LRAVVDYLVKAFDRRKGGGKKKRKIQAEGEVYNFLYVGGGEGKRKKKGKTDLPPPLKIVRDERGKKGKGEKIWFRVQKSTGRRPENQRKKKKSNRTEWWMTRDGENERKRMNFPAAISAAGHSSSLPVPMEGADCRPSKRLGERGKET